MKKLFYTLMLMLGIAIGLYSCSSCNNRPYYRDDTYYEPQAQMGYMGNQSVVYVQDNRGEQFLMNYLLYQQLFSRGGYNSVTSYYYSHPRDNNIHIYNSGSFQRSNSADAQGISRSFQSAYTTAAKSNRTYSPSAKEVRSTIATKQQLYGSKYQPSSGTPTTRTYSPSTSSSSGYSPSASQRSYSPSSSSSSFNDSKSSPSSGSAYQSSRSYSSGSSSTPSKSYWGNSSSSGSSSGRSYSSGSSSSPSRSYGSSSSSYGSGRSYSSGSSSYGSSSRSSYSPSRSYSSSSSSRSSSSRSYSRH